VDKAIFFHMLNGLPAFFGAGKALYPDWSKTGQEIGRDREARLRTFDPVDMQDFIHMDAVFDAGRCRRSR
jgi:hypothetical protein